MDTAHDADAPPLAATQRWGRAMGLPLAALDALARDPARCRAFVRAAEAADFAAVEALTGTRPAPPRVLLLAPRGRPRRVRAR